MKNLKNLKIKKIRLDKYLIENDILSKELIVPYIIEGNIFIEGKKATGVAQMINPTLNIEIKSNTKKYVGRGGFKLEAAFESFNISVKDKICVDFGASTGGFTDVLLQNGAKKVYAVETGKNLLDPKIRNNPKVVNMEDISLFKLDTFSKKSEGNEGNEINKATEIIDLCVIDLSFIPLTHALTQITKITSNAPIIALLKPHYEAHDESLLRKGVVKDEETRLNIVNNFKDWLKNNSYTLKDIIESPIKGGGGNIEYLVYIIKE